MPEPRELATAIVDRLRAEGHAAWLAGGCVRDMLLGRAPSDYDIATAARPDQVQALFPNSDTVGAHFGVVLVKSPGLAIEVATFRSDHAYRDGRRPESVTYETDARRDVMRRDFTINAMLMDPRTGDVVDYAGGREDLARRIVRTVGDPERRFAEDHLRMLRAVRFAARLGFAIDAATLGAIQRQRESLRAISAERVRDELTRILTEGGARRGFELLDETGLLDVALPEVAAMKGVEQPAEFHPEGDVWIHTLLMLEGLRDASPELAWGVLLHDVGKPPTFRRADRIRFDGHVEAGAAIATRLLSRLRFSNGEIGHIVGLVTHHMRFKDAPRMKESTLKRFLRMPRFADHLELHRLDCASSHGLFGNYDYVRAKLASIPEEQLRPARLITGADLIAAGFEPGPPFAAILEMAETAQLEGRIATREEALALVEAAFEKPRGEARPAGS